MDLRGRVRLSQKANSRPAVWHYFRVRFVSKTLLQGFYTGAS